MVGIDRQNLPAEPFGFVQTPNLMMSKSISEDVLNAR